MGRRTKGIQGGLAAQVDWRGSEVLAKAGDAAMAGAEETLDACVERAKSDHGWESQTGTAEESIRIGHVEMTAAGVTGEWGSYGDDAYYFIWLETGSSSIPADDTLRRAADAEYIALASRIRKHLSG